MSGENTETLHLIGLERQNIGEYSCSSRNDLGENHSSTITLRVQCELKINYSVHLDCILFNHMFSYFLFFIPFFPRFQFRCTSLQTGHRAIFGRLYKYAFNWCSVWGRCRPCREYTIFVDLQQYAKCVTGLWIYTDFTIFTVIFISFFLLIYFLRFVENLILRHVNICSFSGFKLENNVKWIS